MNKRLREISEQAMMFKEDSNSVNGKWCFNQEKFAELIIAECAEVTQDFIDHDFPVSEFPIRLKLYFGVE